MNFSRVSGFARNFVTIILFCVGSIASSQNAVYDIGNYVSDVDASQKFYTNVFGFEVVMRWKEMEVSEDGVDYNTIPHKGVYMRDVNGTHLEFIESGNPENYREVQEPINHFAIRVDDVELTIARAIEAGAELAIPISHIRIGSLNVRSGFVFGPDGERIQLVEILAE